jgi:plastocyanin
MRIRRRKLAAVAIVVICSLAGVACRNIGLAAPQDNGGSCTDNPACVAAKASNTLTLSATTTSIPVGGGVGITPTYDGQVLIANSLALQSTVSDSSVLSGGPFSALGLSVGGATITATYQGASASISFVVVPQDGVSGVMYVVANPTTGVWRWFPGAMHVAQGAAVRFLIPNSAVQHNVIFDSVPGAPPNIPDGATGFATVGVFGTVGSFPFHCSIHGEAGVINVVSP